MHLPTNNESCNGWTTANPGVLAHTGYTGFANSRWFVNAGFTGCNDGVERLICVEQ